MIEYYDKDSERLDSPLDLLMYNGGMSTFNEWIEEGAKHEWISYLESLPLTHIYIYFFICDRVNYIYFNTMLVLFEI